MISLIVLCSSFCVMFLFLLGTAQALKLFLTPQKPGPVPVPGGTSVGNLSVTISGDPKSVDVPHPMYPDSILSVVPSTEHPRFFAGKPKFWMCLPEAGNVAGFVNNPFYENNNLRALKPIPSLGTTDNQVRVTHGASFWVFYVCKAPEDDGFICFLHGEDHDVGASALNTYKAQYVSYSQDLVTFTKPEVIVSTAYAGKQNRNYGAGDAGYAWNPKRKEFLCLFYAAGSEGGLARSLDPHARSGTWEVLRSDNTFSPAINMNTNYKKLPFHGGNAQIMYWKNKDCYLLLVAEWGGGESLTFGTSMDGWAWALQKVSFSPGPGSLPLYPSMVHSSGGTMWFDSDSGTTRLYYCDTTKGDRKMMVRSISIKPA